MRMEICQVHPQRNYVRHCHTLTLTQRIQRFRYQFDKEANGKDGLTSKENLKDWDDLEETARVGVRRVRASEMALTRGMGGRQRGARSWNGEKLWQQWRKASWEERGPLGAGRGPWPGGSRWRGESGDWRHQFQEEEAGQCQSQLVSRKVGRTRRKDRASDRGRRSPAARCSIAPAALPRNQAYDVSPRVEVLEEAPQVHGGELHRGGLLLLPPPPAPRRLRVTVGSWCPRQLRPNRLWRSEESELPPLTPPSGLPYGDRACAPDPARPALGSATGRPRRHAPTLSPRVASGGDGGERRLNETRVGRGGREPSGDAD